MEPNPGFHSGLYPRLLGDSWFRLDDGIRRLHGSILPVKAQGVFRVRQGKNWLAGTLARLAHLPTAGEAVDVQLLVTPWNDGQEWRRTFAGRPLVSQHFERPRGRLAERWGFVEMRFRLEVDKGGLIYQTTSSALCLGSLRIRLPRWLSPIVMASDMPVGNKGEIAVSVKVQIPVVGSVIAYDGKLTRIEVQK
jgi:hypothetical protein